MSRPVVLIILDGWGVGGSNESNPIYSAHPKTFKMLEEKYPMGSLQASGINVGLPWGEVGNSEVGHLTLGAGKVVYQYYPRITMAIHDGSFFTNKALKDAFDHARKNGGAVNAVGLLTKATTHAALDHVKALIEMGKKENIPVNLHLFGDAIDGPPKTLEELVAELPHEQLATLIGRYYAMDRSENWQLIQKAYDCLLGKSGAEISDLHSYLETYYQRDLSEEFLPPIIFDKTKCIKDGDAIVFFNFREDGIRELGSVFASKEFSHFPLEACSNLYVTTMTKYDDHFTVPVAFPADKIEEPLAKVISENGKNQIHIAETYKYAHITYFFNGHIEEPFKNEYRVLIPSLKATHPEEHPELMASAITDRVVEAINGRSFDFILVNYSNPDTIAHTGNYEACIEAVKVIDTQIEMIVGAAVANDAVLLITSDHGNMEEVLNAQTGRMETQHDANAVPMYVIAKEYEGKHFAGWPNIKTQTTGILSDVAPTILELMGLPQPSEMTGRSLLGDIL